MPKLCRMSVMLAFCIPGVSFAQDSAYAESGRLTLRDTPRQILVAVARRLDVDLRPNVPPPLVRLESHTPLEHFQDAIEAQWKSRPGVFSNAYATATNEIFLADRRVPGSTRGAALDEMLAHEMVHYIQSRYWRIDLNSEWAEVQACQVQNWFRDTYLSTAKYAASGSR